MRLPQPEPVPAKPADRLADALQQLADAKVDSEAVAALSSTGCDYIPLFLPHVTNRLRYDRESDTVLALDEDGAVMRGGTALHVARSLRRAYPGYWHGVE